MSILFKRKSQEQFEKEVLEAIGADYKVLGEYQGRDVKIEIIHYACGNTFLKRPHDITSKQSGCPFCNGNRRAKYTEQWVKENTPAPYSYITGFQNMTTKCTFYCNNCQIYFEQYPKRLINQKIYGCKCTYRTKKKSHEEFLEELGEECLQEYEVLEPYINCDTKIQFKHLKCGTLFSITPEYFIRRSKKKYCPLCYKNKSKGELTIAQFLDNYSFNYIQNFSFPETKYRYDFYLPDLNVCIEFDGEQHFRPVEHFGGEEEFRLTQFRDCEKNSLCLQKQITLYRIPYYDLDKISQILYKILKEKSSTTIEKYKVRSRVHYK